MKYPQARYVSRFQNSIPHISDVDSQSRRETIYPHQGLVHVIPRFWQMLEMCEYDWQTLRSGDDYRLSDYLELQIAYLKCLFSYVTFCESLMSAYELLNEDLRHLNHAVNARTKGLKKIDWEYPLTTVRIIRNLSIAHVPSQKWDKSGYGTHLDNKLDVMQGAMWELSANLAESATDLTTPLQSITFQYGGKKPVRLTLAGGTAIEASNMYLEDLSAIHPIVMAQLTEVDDLAFEHLQSILRKMPYEDGKHTFQLAKSGVPERNDC